MGGFLGLGERTVAIAWDEIEIAENGEGDKPKIRTTLSREDLQRAPQFDPASTAAGAPANASGGV